MRVLVLLCLLSVPTLLLSQSIDEHVKDGYSQTDGVKVHYVSMGNKKNPLVVMIHGFPDFWYTWRNVMSELSKDYYTVAIDQRGYNLSDKPKGVDNYSISKLVGDVSGLIKNLGYQKAIIIGHDWGGVVSWSLAEQQPQQVEKLIVLNTPHLRGLKRELANNVSQQKNSQYARSFLLPDTHTKLTAERLAGWVTDPEVKKKYVEAFGRTDFEAILNYYKSNFPREPYKEDTTAIIKVKAPVLIIYGLNDTALLPAALNNTWDLVDNSLTLITVPKAGHFVQQDAPDVVIQSITMWLRAFPIK